MIRNTACGQLARTARAAVLLTTLTLGGLRAVGQVPAFPGAEGYGGTFLGTAPAAGWFSSATVYHVTNLNDSGPGSLRAAFVQNSTNKIVVFDVGGTINLTTGSLDIKNLSNYYIAGQTAPSPVTIVGATTQITASNNRTNSNVVLRYMAFRGSDSGADAITFAGGNAAAPSTNMIIDHVSASWAEDEVLSVTNQNTNVTVQYSIIADALTSNHAYGSLIRPQLDSNVSFHHNLYANNVSRQARFGTYNSAVLTADFRNNVIYNFRDRTSYSGGSSEPEQEKADVNYVGNYQIAGPGTTGTANRVFTVDKNTDTRIYQSGNFADADKALNPGGVPNGTLATNSQFVINNQTDQTLTMMASPFATPAVTTQAAADSFQQVRSYVGNSWWARDVIDARIINNLNTNTGPPGGIGLAAPNATELANVMAAPTTAHPAGYDADNDGMADAWETAHGGDLVWNQDFDNDGYINLIEFVNELGEFPAPAPIVFTGGVGTRYARIENWRTDDGGVTAGTMWQPSKYDLAIIDNATVVVDAVGQHAGTLVVGGQAGHAATLNITSGWLRANDEVVVGSMTGAGTVTLSPSGLLAAPEVTVDGMGLVTGSGQIEGTIINGGVVAPGADVGTIHVTGDFLQTATGELAFDIASLASFDRLTVDGAITLAGMLSVTLQGGFTPSAGDAFDLLDFSSLSGSFTLSLPTLGGGLAWNADDLGTTGVLSVVAAAADDADFNDDGIVDGIDFLVWQRGNGQAGGHAAGDANGNGFVDGNDLTIFNAQYGTPGGATSSVGAVPEPAAVVLAFFFAWAGVAGRRSHRA